MEVLLNSPLSWVAIGLIFVIAETLVGDGTLLSFGCSGIILGAMIWLLDLKLGVLWPLVIFVALSLLVSMLTRRLMKKTGRYKGDINTY
jgi:membrane protein implicated in regulation of membrane protease activity